MHKRDIRMRVSRTLRTIGKVSCAALVGMLIVSHIAANAVESLSGVMTKE